MAKHRRLGKSCIVPLCVGLRKKGSWLCVIHDAETLKGDYRTAVKARPHKYGAVATTVDGIRFQSKKEAARWGELQLLQRAGAISSLRRQQSFDLIVNGILVCKYVADAAYMEGDTAVAEDSKGVRTPEYRLKAKLMLACHGITIRET